MYKHEKVPDNFSYISNYEDFYDKKITQTDSTSFENDKFCKNFENSYKTKKVKLRKYFKMFFSVFILISGIFVFSLVLSTLGKTSKTAELKEYDDLIWPVVLQDPPEFDEKKPLNFDLKLRSAIWDASFKLKNDENLFNEEGKLIVSEEEIQKSAEKLFGNKLEFSDFKFDNDDFFSFDHEKNIFLVNAVSADERPIPHTISARLLKGKTLLEVEYFVPEKENAKPEKTMKYLLKNNSSNGKYIAEIKNSNVQNG